MVRAVLGDPSKALQLNRSFLDKVEKALSIDRISSEAWWATDYHLSWLAGALTVYSEGVVDKRTRANQWGESNGVISHLIEGNQEDIDLIIASGLDLVLVEAKGVGAWDVQQLESKLARLNLIRSEVKEAGVKFHLLLTSPHRPENLEARCKVDCCWALMDSKFAWIELPFPSDTLAVSRCDENGRPAAELGHWCIIES